jgi:hypothetical protein
VKVLRKLIVDAYVELVGIKAARAGAGVIVVDAAIAEIGQWHRLQEIDRRGRQAGCREDISSKWRTAGRTGRIALRVVSLIDGATAQAGIEIIAHIAVAA